MESAILLYENLVGDIEEYGFIINPYNPCVENMKVDEKQLTICWHVNDLKISYVHKKEVSKLIAWLKYRNGEMNGLRGSRPGYLVMWIDYSIK